jgi:transposase
MEQDMTSTAEIHERLAAKELLPDEHFVDSAYIVSVVGAAPCVG